MKKKEELLKLLKTLASIAGAAKVVVNAGMMNKRVKRFAYLK
jgi:hypothetical protein